MEENLVEKCRSCLKENLKLIPLSILAKEYSGKLSYGKLLQESANLQSLPEYEHFMPQNICLLCCKELKQSYTFIRQAQFSNKILMNFIERQLPKTTQNPNTMPDMDVNDIEEDSSDQRKTGTNDFEVGGTNVLRPIKIEKATEHDEQIQDFPYENEEEFCKIEENNSENSIDLTYCKKKTPEDFEQHYDDSELNNAVEVKNETHFDNFYTTEQTEQNVTTNQVTNNGILMLECMRSEGQIFNNNISIDLPLEHSSEDSSVLNIIYFQTDNNAEHINISEAIKAEDELNSISSNDSTADELAKAEDISESELFQMTESDQNSIISEIKIEETEIGENHITKKTKMTEVKSKRKPIKCPSCDYLPKNYFHLYYHKLTRHMKEEDKLKCHFCSYKHILKHNLFNHIKNKHKQLIKTLKAETNWQMKSSITNEEASTSSISKQLAIEEMENSGEEFLSDDNIPLQQKPKEQKQQTHDQDSDDEFIKDLLNIRKTNYPRRKCKKLVDKRPCDKCGKIFNSYNSLYVHKRNHINEDEKFPCPNCDAKFKRKPELNKHIKMIHEFKPKDEKEISYKCSNCSFTTTSQCQLKIHNRMYHATDRPYKCNVCSKLFARRDVLLQHSYTHSGRTFECNICSQSFRHRANMIAHRHRHSRVKQSCKDCGSLVKDLRRHKKKCPAMKNKNC